MKLGVLVSGNLGYKVLCHLITEYQIDFVATDFSSENIISLARKNKIRFFVGNPRKGNLVNKLKNFDCDVIISVNYLFIIEKDLISIARKISVNIHGSLLPKYRGRTPHVWAIINNEKKCGITAHLIEEECDSGKIIFQKEIKINKNDTGFNILSKYEKQYPNFVDKVLQMIKKDSIKLRRQNHSLSTYFHKRIPSDGKINWNWQKERINNWIRAQSFPYPGAFTFYNKKKVIIDKILFSSYGYNQNYENGMIVNVIKNIPYVKTENGVIKLTSIRNNDINFKKYDILK